MDENSKKEQRAAFRILSIEVGVIIIGIIIIFAVLNFTGIFPLSQIFPEFFGWLPENKSTEQEQVTPENNETKDAYQFACPMDVEQCAGGKILYDTEKEKLAGLAYRKLLEGTMIYAVMDGEYTYTTEEINGRKVVNLTLTGVVEDADQIFETTYVFEGTVPPIMVKQSSGKVARGEAVGIAGGAEIEILDFTSQPYSLYVEVKEPESGAVLPLEPSEDGLGLVPR